jgi:UDP-N-acetylmuramoylalanine--D-glutamate ligase
LGLPLKIKKPIAIIGMGISGKACLDFLLRIKIPRHEIITFDEKSGKADTSDTQTVLKMLPKTFILSPGVPMKSQIVQDLLACGSELTSEVDLASKFLTTEKVIAITGSLGKSTTTSLIGVAARTQDPNCFIGGNIGTPLIQYISELQSQPSKKASYIVIELSSFQIEALSKFNSECVVYTYLSKNHLDRYDSLNDYYSTKWKLTEHCRGPIFINGASSELLCFATNKSKTFNCVMSNDAKNLEKFGINTLRVFGKHNYQNAGLACAVAWFFKWDLAAFQAISEFPGMPHRLENLNEHKDVLFINDSKATSIESVEAAITACSELNRPLHVLIGGKDKGLDWTLLEKFKNTNIQFYFFGKDGKMFQDHSRLSGQVFKTFADCLIALESVLCPKDVVLLSPGGSSLDEFKSFEERGNFFKAWVSKFQN